MTENPRKQFVLKRSIGFRSQFVLAIRLFESLIFGSFLNVVLNLSLHFLKRMHRLFVQMLSHFLHVDVADLAILQRVL